jgi:hypothetical protein
MRPVSIWSLSICAVVALAAFVVSILFDFHKLDVTVWWSAVKNGGVLAALVFGLVHYFSSIPRILHYTESEWEVTGENWNEVFIRIPKSRHWRGKTPTVTFIRPNEFLSCDSKYTYKVEKNGDIVICHCQNRFMKPWLPISVKITK